MTEQTGKPQHFVEHGLATSTADDCMVVVRERTSANLRWANNTLTTNGVMSGLDVSVISFVGAATGFVGNGIGGLAIGSFVGGPLLGLGLGTFAAVTGGVYGFVLGLRAPE